MRIFERCARFTEARRAQREGVYPYYLPVEEARDREVRVGDRWILMMGSNNYLGLTHHPRVLEAAREALDRFGVGCTGSRLLNGNLALHDELEGRLAEFLGTEDALVFTTGYLTNLGTISALVGRGDHVFLDRLNHACIVDGARLSHGTVHRYAHGDLEELADRLAAVPVESGKLVATDGVFSMDGDIVDLPAILELARRHDAAVLVDDAHALGVLGPDGAGTASHFGLRDERLLVMATFSKSLGSIGGVLAGPEEVCHFLRHRARSLLFSASMPPASLAGALAALRILQEEPERRERLWANTRRMREGLRAVGLDTGGSETPILPVFVGSLERVLRFWRGLFDRGVYVNAVVPPGVPDDASRLRVSLSAVHTPEDVDRAVEAFAEVDRALPEAM